MKALRDEVDEITLEDLRETENTKPLEEMTPISIHPDYPNCHVMIGTELTDELRNALVEFLKKNYNVVAWSQGDHPQVVVHKLFIDTDYSLVCQKRRKFALECLKIIEEEEVVKLIKTNVIKESHYPEWLANVVVVPKKGESGKYVLTLRTSTRIAQKTVFIFQRLI